MSGARVTIRPNRSAIRRLMDASTPGGAYMLRLGNRVLNNSRTKVNVDTGLLRSTGTVEQHGEVTIVAYRTRYARRIHDGFGSYPGNPYLSTALSEELARL